MLSVFVTLFKIRLVVLELLIFDNWIQCFELIIHMKFYLILSNDHAQAPITNIDFE